MSSLESTFDSESFFSAKEERIGTKPSVLQVQHIEIDLPFEGDAERHLHCLSKSSLQYHGIQIMFHPSTPFDTPLICIFQSVASILTSMQLSLDSPLGLCDYMLFHI